MASFVSSSQTVNARFSPVHMVSMTPSSLALADGLKWHCIRGTTDKSQLTKAKGLVGYSIRTTYMTWQ